MGSVVQIESPHTNPDRILSFGSYASGKTHNWFQWLRHIEGKAYVIDTDQTVTDFLDSGLWDDVADRVIVREPWEWPEFVAAVKEFRKKAKPTDLLVIDMMNRPWDVVQNYFSEQYYGVELGDHWMNYMIQAKESPGSKSPFDGTTDWQAIKKMYAQFTNEIVRTRCHKYFACPEKKLGPFDGSEIQEGYAEIGWKPDCEKHTGHMVRTVLRCVRKRITTVKDRGRAELQGVKVNDFAFDYLVKVAGWKPKV